VGDERRSGESVVLVLGDQVPSEHGHLAGGGDDSLLEPAAGFDALVERAERAGCPRGGPRGLDQHPADVGAAGLADPPVHRCGVARLAHPRVEPEIGDQLVRVVEAAEVADRGHDRDPGDRVDAGDRHQPGHHRIG